MEIISTLINTNGAGSGQQQSAEEIIPLLCDRLANSKLASDKRAAILTLKGFSRGYRELVVANGLRGLISTLKEYSIHSDIIKPLLETLLILFIRGESDDDMTRGWISQQSRVKNGKYPSPLLLKDDQQLDQFSLWIADELTQDQDLISAIVSLLENESFHIRIYTLQLLESLVAVRPIKTKEMLLNSTLGVPLLVEILNDVHDPVRNEAILLLLAIANDNFNIQKLIAFDSTFDKLFDIIHEEGDIRGSIVVQDCLTLLSNLLKYNISNQKLFLETNCLPKLAFLLSEPLNDEDQIAWNDQRLQNIIMCLDIVKLFVIEDNQSTKFNQELFFKSEIFFHILRLSFSQNIPNSLRAASLLTVANLIYKNQDIQEQFNSIDVPYIDPSLPQQLQEFNADKTIPVVNALLNWCLFLNSVHVFDIRVSAAKVLSSYFRGNAYVRSKFLEGQISRFMKDNEDDTSTDSVEVANLFHVLLDYDPELKLNPYKVWFSSYILIDMLSNAEDDAEKLKSLVKNIKIGNVDEEEEVLTPIQTVSGLLVTTLHNSDPRIAAAYLIFLIVWLFEDFEAVNDFLADSSNLNAMLTFLTQSNTESNLVQGLVTILFGIVFEFSSAGSPISRVDLHAMIVKRLSKDNYSFKILQLKENKHFKEFDPESIFNPSKGETGLPDVFLEPNVVFLIKENYYRIKTALNQDPNVESSGKLSFQKFDQLKGDFIEVSKNYEDLLKSSKEEEGKLTRNLEEVNTNYSKLNQELESTKAELQTLQETHSQLELNFKNITSELGNLKQLHNDLTSCTSQKDKDLVSMTEKITIKEKEVNQLKSDLDNVTKEKKKAEEGINKLSRELMNYSKEKENLTSQVGKLEKEIKSNSQTISKLEQNLKNKTDRIESMDKDITKLSAELKEVVKTKTSLEKEFGQLKSSEEKDKSIISQLSEKLRSLANVYNTLSSEKSSLETKLGETEKGYQLEINTIKSELEQLKSSNHLLSELNKSLESEKAKIGDELAILKNQHSEAESNLQKSLDISSNNLKSLQSELESSKSLCLKYEGQIGELNGTLKSYKQEFESLKSTHVDELSKAAEGHGLKLDELQKKFDDAVKLNDESCIGLKAQLEELVKSKELISKELDEHKEKVKQHGETLNSKETEISNFVSSLHESEKKLESLSEDKAISEEHIQKLESELETVVSTKEQLEADKATLSAKLESKESELKKQINSLKEEISSFEEEKHSLEASLEVISQRIEIKDKEFEAITGSLNSTKSELEKLNKSLTKVTNEKEKAESLLGKAKLDLEDLKSKNAEIRVQLEKANENIRLKDQSIKTSKAKLEEEKKKSEEKVKKLESEISLMRESIDKKAEEFEKERSLLTENSSSTTKEYSERVNKLEEELKTVANTNSEKIKSLDKEILGLQETVSELKNEREILKNDLESKENKLNELKTESAKFESEAESLKIELDDAKKLADNVSSLTDELSERNTAIESLKADLETKSKSLRENQAALDEMTSENDVLRETNDSNKKGIESLESQIEEKTELVEKLQGIEKQFKDFKSSTEKSKELSDSERSQELSALKAELKDSKEQLETLNQKLEAAEKETNMMNSRIEDANKSKDASLKSHQDEISKLKAVNEELESQLQCSQKGGDELAEKLKAKNSELSSKLTELEESLKMQVEELSSEKKSLLKKIEHLQSEVSKLTTELSTTTSKLKKSGTQIQDHETKAEDLSAENKKLLEELELLKSQAKNSSSLSEENKKLKEDLEALKGATVPKSELDDLMLVLDDLDEKKREYKNKVKSLGGDVSSDEEDDDDDEEDDYE